MEDIEINPNKDSNNMKTTHSLKSNKKYYNCSECQSEINIIYIDEELIEFECKNNHNIKIQIKDYLDKIQNKTLLNSNLKINNSKCNKHKEEYFSYCFTCNMHLCKKCLKTGQHVYKINKNVLININIII